MKVWPTAREKTNKMFRDLMNNADEDMTAPPSAALLFVSRLLSSLLILGLLGAFVFVTVFAVRLALTW